MALNQHQAKTILEANTVNLAKKVAAGRPLSPRELALLESIAVPAGEASDTSLAQVVWAPSQMALAEAIGVTRQCISYHCRRRASPGRTTDGRYNVEDWRAYLEAFGRLRASGGGKSGPARSRLDFADGCWAAIDAVARELPGALGELGLKAKSKEADRAVYILWNRLARAVDRCATGFQFESYFEPDTMTGKASYPDAIAAIAGRVTAANSASTPEN